jgi:hypothetical protein
MASITTALKASRALAAHGIFAEVISLSAAETRHGCAYGVSFACAELERVRTILKSNGVTPTQYLQRGNLP